MRFCLEHGFNAPECKCGDDGYFTSSQGFGKETPMSRAEATRVVDMDISRLQILAFVLGIFGYDVVVHVEGSFKAPLQKVARDLVPVLDTNASVEAIMAAIEFINR